MKKNELTGTELLKRSERAKRVSAEQRARKVKLAWRVDAERERLRRDVLKK